MNPKYKICSVCIYDERTPAISFDEAGLCSYCQQINFLKDLNGTGTQTGEDSINKIVREIREKGKSKKYDCAIGVSGGTDSSYMLHWAVQKGLRPLAVHYDNTWNTAITTENIRKMTAKLNIDLFTIVVDNKEADDLLKSFLLSGSSDLDAPTDLALSETMYRAADIYNIDYVLEGHSFITEGVSTLSNSYVDGKYIESIHATYGSRKLKTFPNMKLMTFLKWVLFKQIKKIRPLWYIEYNTQDAQKFLIENGFFA